MLDSVRFVTGAWSAASADLVQFSGRSLAGDPSFLSL